MSHQETVIYPSISIEEKEEKKDLIEIHEELAKFVLSESDSKSDSEAERVERKDIVYNIQLNEKLITFFNEKMDAIESLKPTAHCDSVYKMMAEGKRRWAYISQYGYAYPDKNTIRTFARFVQYSGGTLLSVGSGHKAFIESLLTHFVDKVIATDAFCSDGSERRERGFMNVEDIKACDAVTKYSTVNAIMFVWPSNGEDWAAQALELFLERLNSTSVVIYWGEEQGGCTANYRFHELLDEHLERVEICSNPVYWGLHDYAEIYMKKL